MPPGGCGGRYCRWRRIALFTRKGLITIPWTIRRDDRNKNRSPSVAGTIAQIVENAGKKRAVIVGEVEQLKGNRGFNALTGEFEDLVAAGVIDPTKVVRTALQNAASIAGLLLTTDAAITDMPEPKKAAPPMPAGDDYDY
jgi:hypothetical protein